MSIRSLCSVRLPGLHKEVTVLAVWTLLVPAHDSAPEMLYSTIDGRDLTAEGMERRNVTITLRVGPKDQPYFDGVVGYGFHVRQP